MWIKEYTALMKNPLGYEKLFDGSWDFDIFMDMLFSFWLLRPIPTTHKRVSHLRSPSLISLRLSIHFLKLVYFSLYFSLHLLRRCPYIPAFRLPS